MTSATLSPTPEREMQAAARPSAVSHPILYGTLRVGTLDAADGVAFCSLHGVPPIPVLQYIASARLGARSFSVRLATAGLGVVHFAVALIVVAIYILASRLVATLHTPWALLGLLYGAAVWAVMNLVVWRLTAVASSPITTVALLNGVIGHGLFVGLPSELFANTVAAK